MLDADEEGGAGGEESEFDQDDEDPVADGVDDLLAEPGAEEGGGGEGEAEQQDLSGEELTGAVGGEFSEVHGEGAGGFGADVGAAGEAGGEEERGGERPTEPRSADPSPDAAPIPAKAGFGGRWGWGRRWRQITVAIKKPPRSRCSGARGA